jgi:hypothetical protein
MVVSDCDGVKAGAPNADANVPDEVGETGVRVFNINTKILSKKSIII